MANMYEVIQKTHPVHGDLSIIKDKFGVYWFRTDELAMLCGYKVIPAFITKHFKRNNSISRFITFMDKNSKKTKNIVCLNKEGLVKFFARITKEVSPSFKDWIFKGILFNESPTVSPTILQVTEQCNPIYEYREYSHDIFESLRVINVEGSPWFVIKDLVDALGLDSTSYASNNFKCGRKDRSLCHLKDVSAKYTYTIVSLQGLRRFCYREGMREKTAEYMDWVEYEVVPQWYTYHKIPVPEYDYPKIETEDCGEYMTISSEPKTSMFNSVKPSTISSEKAKADESNVSIFTNALFGEIRVLEKEGNPWFVAKDICDALGIGNSRQTLTYLDEDEKGVTTNDTLGGIQNTSIINESGLYSLILRSRKPEAKVFKKWVTSDVLPSIRKTGGYIHTTEQDTPETIMAKAVLIAQTKINQLTEANTTLSIENKSMSDELNNLTVDEYTALRHEYYTKGQKSALGKKASEICKMLNIPKDIQVTTIKNKNYEMEIEVGKYSRNVLDLAKEALEKDGVI